MAEVNPVRNNENIAASRRKPKVSSNGVKILIEGWLNADCKKRGKEPSTAATVTLVRDGEIIAVVDPGEMPEQKMLVDALAKENLKISDITHVFQTHSHIDHVRNTGMFAEDIKIICGFGEWQAGRDKTIRIGKNYSENIKIIETHGHANDALTFLVKTKIGLIAICGDVFWKENYPKTPDEDPYADDRVELKKSREKVLKLADFIIPGHGGMFKVEK